MTFVLVLIASVAGLAIGFTYSKTEGRIEQIERETTQKALQDVLPEGLPVEKRESTVKGLPRTYWVATAHSNPAAYAFEVESRGYSSDIKFMVGVDTSGRVLGLTIMDQGETPGLGTRVAEVVSKNYLWTAFSAKGPKADPWFPEQFEGLNVQEEMPIDKSRGEWHALDKQARKELREANSITAITGATISTRAVQEGLREKVARYMQILTEEG